MSKSVVIASPDATGALPRGATAFDHPGMQIGAFALTLFASALMLFSVQPLFAKLALPKLGGSPSVWAVSMCFFQAVLLAGYIYAHLLTRLLTPAHAILGHIGLLAVTWLALPIGLPAGLGDPPPGDAYIWLTGVLVAGVGAPFFTVSATAPLLQAWFAQSGHAKADDPYFLYGASNLGSLLALLSYPLLIERTLGLAEQTRLWSLGFVALAAMIVLCGALMLRMHRRSAAGAGRGVEGPAGHATDSTPTRTDRALWVVLAAIPSGLSVAVTTLITTDLAAAPFLWVLPLSLFLATFILVFRTHVPFPYPWLCAAYPVIVLAQLVVTQRGPRMVLSLVAFLCAALICHRELYLRRPAARHLTAFYIWMSLGGVLGGVFAALLAPRLFTSVFEFSALLIAALFSLPGILIASQERLDRRRLIAVACLLAAALILQSVATDLAGYQGQRWFFVGFVALAAPMVLLMRDWPERKVIMMMALAAIATTVPHVLSTGFAERSFFGTVRVAETLDGLRVMMHGTTMHGARRVRTADGMPVSDPVPATYYTARGPMGRGFEVARAVQSATAPATGSAASPVRTIQPIRAGIVGLGTGSLACHRKAGDDFRFYEIDPLVVKVAKDPRHFDFLSRCAPDAPVVVGDARLTLGREPPAAFDYLVIDAFSSDSVPTHLMTVEAMELYLSKLAPTGILALHVSNQYMDLIGAVSGTLAEVPGIRTALIRYRPSKSEDPDGATNHVVMITRHDGAIESIRAWPDAVSLPRSGGRAWSDDFSDVLSAVLRRLKG